jgi:hypothetical protein
MGHRQERHVGSKMAVVGADKRGKQEAGKRQTREAGKRQARARQGFFFTFFRRI